MFNNNAQVIVNDNNLPNSGIAKIKSRFGILEIDYSKAIFFPKGLYGFPENLHFALINFPNKELQNFKILQCLNDESISFPVLPVAYNNEFIHDKDMHELATSLEVEAANMAVLFIASSEKSSDGSFKVAINSKAPIIVDTNLKMAVQYIFTNNKYSTKQYI